MLAGCKIQEAKKKKKSSLPLLMIKSSRDRRVTACVEMEVRPICMGSVKNLLIDMKV